MKTQSNSRERGFGHIGLILAVVGVLVVGGLVAWRFLGANDNKASVADKAAESIAQQVAQAKCDYDDKDICKFFTSWKLHTNYKMVGTTTDSESGTNSSFTYEIDGDNTHSVMTGEFASEIISVGKRTTYTKAADGTWWKQTLPETNDPQTPVGESKPEFEEPTTDDQTDAPKSTYKSLGKEACGSLTCFKYQITDPSTSDISYIWFDDKDYQLRRSLTESSTGKSDYTYSYSNVTVKAPATFKELGPNQYLMPGASEPTTIPVGGDGL